MKSFAVKTMVLEQRHISFGKTSFASKRKLMKLLQNQMVITTLYTVPD